MLATRRLRSIDQNLLPILYVLLEKRNVTKAAAVLCLSQSAVSKALARLRLIFNDQLLARRGSIYVLTPRAEILAPLVEAQCRNLENLWGVENFDPRTSARTFTIATIDYPPLVVLPVIAPILAETAPNISLEFVDAALESIANDCADVDFVFAPRPILNQFVAGGGKIASVFSDDFVRVVSADHRLARKGPAAADVQNNRHVTWGLGDRSEYRLAIQPPFRQRNQLATLPDFGSVLLVAQMTGTVAIAPRRLVKAFSVHIPLTILEGPVSRSAIDICLGWSAWFDDDPGHRWLRKLILSEFAPKPMLNAQDA